jgi:hypothetical protein
MGISKTKETAEWNCSVCPGSSRDFIIGHKELKELLLLYINL